MEFKFDVSDVFTSPIIEVNQSLIPPGFIGDRRALTSVVSKVTDVIDTMGNASASAQGLSKPITTADRLRNQDQTVYLLVDRNARGGKGVVNGMLKTGRKSLYIFDRDGQHYHVSPPCILDFYVHESKQRQGLGKQLFEHMLQKEQVDPSKLAIDRPSEKLLSFLNKHYRLENAMRQMNNYVVFDGFFPEKNGESNSPCAREPANGLQALTTPYGRYGAPRPPCSMGQQSNPNYNLVSATATPTTKFTPVQHVLTPNTGQALPYYQHPYQTYPQPIQQYIPRVYQTPSQTPSLTGNQFLTPPQTPYNQNMPVAMPTTQSDKNMQAPLQPAVEAQPQSSQMLVPPQNQQHLYRAVIPPQNHFLSPNVTQILSPLTNSDKYAQPTNQTQQPTISHQFVTPHPTATMPPPQISQPQIMQGQQAMLPQPAIIPQPPMTPQQYISTPQIIPQQQILTQQPAQTQSVVLNQNTPGTNQQQHSAAPPSQSLSALANQNAVLEDTTFRDGYPSQRPPNTSDQPPQQMAYKYYDSTAQAMQMHDSSKQAQPQPQPNTLHNPNASGDTHKILEDSINQSPKLERPRSLTIQPSEDSEIGEKQILHNIKGEIHFEDTIDESVDDHIERQVVPALDSARIGDTAELQTFSDDSSTSRKSPGSLTAQGFFDLKFYHSRLW
ncbi:hypothetical protein FQA39_LY12481 [Lamprigera yunnana]|nr:hypothetical protein FQA39_LY12481 [Lamprigera yunnana]